MNNYTTLGKFQRNSLSTLHIQSMICHSGTWKKLLKTRSTFSPLTPHIFHDGNGSKQVDPLPTLYTRIKSHSPKVNSTIHSFPSFYSREKTDLTVGGSLVGLHRSPLTVLSFLFRTKKPSPLPETFQNTNFRAIYIYIYIHTHIYIYTLCHVANSASITRPLYFSHLFHFPFIYLFLFSHFSSLINFSCYL